MYVQVLGDKVLEMKFNIGPGHIDKYLVLMDGTEFYSSNAIGCDCCLMNSGKNSEKAEDVRFHHQLLSAAIAHTDEKIVIPGIGLIKATFVKNPTRISAPP